MTCASPTDCTAIVSDGTSTWSAHSADFGQSWQQEGNLPAGFLPGNDLTCMAGGTCIDAGYVPTTNGHGQGAVAVSADGGQTWALASVPAGIGVLQSTACLSASGLPRRRHDRDHGQRRRPGQGRAPPQHGRGTHVGAVDRRAARR